MLGGDACQEKSQGPEQISLFPLRRRQPQQARGWISKSQIRAKGLKFSKGHIAGFDGFFQVALSMSQR
jgi:hypothetical protein